MFSAQKDNDMVECPYNKAHRLLRKRLQGHLLKCRQSYPDVELQKCPFNQTHLIPEPEFVHHVTNCPDRKLITQYKYDAPPTTNDDELQRPKQEEIQCDENWDDSEVQDYNPEKYLETSRVLRQPVGVHPSDRKAFVKQERKRLGDYDSSEDEKEEKAKVKKYNLDKPKSSDEEDDYEYSRRRPMTPPPPTHVAWFEDVAGRKVDSRRRISREESSRSKRHRSRSKERLAAGSASKRCNAQSDYSLDEDPYYNGGGDVNGRRHVGESHPVDDPMPSRGYHTSDSHSRSRDNHGSVGSIPGRYDQPYYKY